MITLWDRVKMEPDELRERFSYIIKKYNTHFNDGDFEVSFLLAQSLFEDRVNVLWILGAWHQKTDDYWDVLKPEVDEYKRKSISIKIRELSEWDIINHSTAKQWKGLMNLRNNLIHFSLFNTDEYTEETCSRFFNEFRNVDKLIADFKRKTKFYESF